MKTSTLDIHITRIEKSRINQFDPDNIQFGKLYSDHMLVCNYENGIWQQVEVVPFHNFSFSPATTFIHYGQAIFEGIKAYKDNNGNPIIFRPDENWRRMNVSALRMDMPEIPEEIFMEGMRELI